MRLHVRTGNGEPYHSKSEFHLTFRLNIQYPFGSLYDLITFLPLSLIAFIPGFQLPHVTYALPFKISLPHTVSILKAITQSTHT